MALTGYRITKYLDVNPQSPTFNTTREERVYDAQHCSGDVANWEVVTSYCELSGGSRTGYYITTEMDTNLDSPTYGETRDTRAYNTTRCPLQSDEPEWVIDTSTMYCEVKEFPSGLSGETGVLKFKMKDENMQSPTHNQIVESSMTESDWTAEYEQAYGEFPCEAVDTEPDIEVISEACVMVICGGVSTTNGTKRIFGLDKNKYSDTYLESVERIVTDTDTCPDNCSEATYIFTWTDSTSAKTINTTYSANTINVSLVSTKNGNAQPFTVQTGTATIVGQGIMAAVTENTSETNTKTTTIILKQNDSNKLITLEIVQAPKPHYDFMWSDSSTTKSVTIAASATSSTYNIISKKNNSYIGYTIDESCDWVSGTSGNSSVTIKTTQNTSSGRTCTINLTQAESGKEIRLILNQSEPPTIKVYASSNKYLLDGKSGTTFTVHYWYTINGSIQTDGVSLETVPIEEGESALTITQISSGNDGKLYKTYSVNANDVNHERVVRFRATYNNMYSNIITVKQSGVDQTVLPDFDYLTFTFNWGITDGRDLDTATFVLGSHLPILSGKTLDVCPVGYACSGSSETYSAATKVYLQHGGDNTQSGNECALVNWKTICNHDYISEGITTLKCELYANWYNEYQIGNCSIAFKTYKGDGMKHGTEDNPYIFVPSGNTELVSQMTVSGHVQAFSTTNASERRLSPTGDEKGYYSHVATLEYDIASKSAFFTNRMTTPSGRNLRGYGTVDGTLVVGSNSSTIGKTEIAYDANSQVGSITFGSFYNDVNGVIYNATDYVVDIKYYAKDGHPLQEGYATASINNGVLSWTLQANPTGERREVDFVLTGKQDIRNITYRVECIQS